MLNSTSLRHPALHLNGTSADDLRAQYLAAYEAIVAALPALAAAGPNQRDYYVQADADVAWTEARDQHLARYAAVEAVRDQFAQLVLEIDDARIAKGVR